MVNSAAVVGIQAFVVEIEVDSKSGLPGESIVGLPDASVRESRDRVRTAIRNCGFDFPHRFFTINLAPADIRKEGPAFDLPIAAAILAATHQVILDNFKRTVFLGELSLDGRLRPVKGVLPIALMAKRNGFTQIVLPIENAREAAIVSGITAISAETLKDVAEILNGEKTFSPCSSEFRFQPDGDDELDMSDVKGQGHVKRALEIAAAGGHNILLVGPPGCGKTMLARRLSSIMPPITFDEAVEISQVYSVTGRLNRTCSLITRRPFRSPHHTASYVAVVGGGTSPRPGEVSLAHRGILFLDELPEFRREVLEVMRQPLEEGAVTIARAAASVEFPARFLLAAAMNPCRCGFAMDDRQQCRCSPSSIRKYWSKVSGPLLDRIDLQVEVCPLNKDELVRWPQAESSEVVRKRVIAARQIQQSRFKKTSHHSNADITSREIKRFSPLNTESQRFLERAVVQMALSARAYVRVLKVARTIADLEGSGEVGISHLAQAVQFRSSENLRRIISWQRPGC